ncbi:sigma-54-dependent transcriptional regulator [Candidatus Margulisiibacteriota bacterium]
MPKSKPQILVIDDEDSMLRTYKSVLKSSYNVTLLNSGRKAFEVLKDGNFSLLLLDLMMPEMNGLEVLKKIREIDKNLEVIMVTAVHDIKSAVQAIKLGAYDYITKPFEVEGLLSVVSKALERRALLRENVYLRQLVEEKGSYLNLIGKTEAMKKVFNLIDKIAATESTVLVTGESGTGKELVAHAVHRGSSRAKKPFIVVNCAAIPESLIESELFGHERGAFTGAMERKEGKFELADGGTIFLDEIGCMKSSLQSKMLRVLQDNVIERVGGGKPIQVDVRVIAATNLDIEETVKKREFREDLYYRINVMRVHLPPLRERKDDVPLLLGYFVEKYNKELKKKIKGFNKCALGLLMEYDWPGNVRELQNMVERVVALSENKEEIPAEDIPMENASHNIVKKGLKEATMDFEKRYIKNVLCETGGNQTKAADVLSINRTTLIAKIKQLGLKS